MKKKLIALLLVGALVGGVSTTTYAASTNDGELQNTYYVVGQKFQSFCSNIDDIISDLICKIFHKDDCSNDEVDKDESEDNSSTPDKDTSTDNNTSNDDSTQEDTSDDDSSDQDTSNGDNNITPPPVNDNTSKPDVEDKPSEDENISTDKFLAQVEELIYEKVNAERSKVGVSTLKYNTTMEKYARIKSQDMGDNNYFSHEDLQGNLITVNMQNDGVSYRAWGENIAYIGGVSDANALANQFMTNWMNSTGHRQNILSTNFTDIGIGVYKSGNKVYATQEFYK